MVYLGNAFSINMLDIPDQGKVTVEIKDLSTDEARAALVEHGFKSVVGHPSLAPVLKNLLGLDVEFNRESITLTPKDILIVAQYRGPRLEEGATDLPEGAVIRFYKVTIG